MGLFKRISTLIKTNENTALDKRADSDESLNQTATDTPESPITTKSQAAIHLSRKDSIKRLNLAEDSFNSLTSVGTRTVGGLLKLVDSGKLQTISTLGQESISEIKGKLAQVKILDNPEVEENTGTASDQDDGPLSQEDLAEESSLAQDSPNQITHTDSQIVGEGTQHIESSELQTSSEDEVNADVMPDQNDVSIPQDDSAEELSLSQRPSNLLAPHTESQTSKEGTQQTESGEPATTAEIEANTNIIRNHNNIYFSREDAIEKLNLPRRSLKRLKRANIRTVGVLAQRIESGRFRTIYGLGSRSIEEIKERLAQVKILDNSEVEADTMPGQDNAFPSREDAAEEQSLTQHSPNPLVHTEGQTVGEAARQVESGKPLTIPESEADGDAILDQDDVPLSQENSTKKIRLTRQTLNQIKQTDIRTVGELLQWIESGKPSTTPPPGLESISEIKGRLAQAKALDEPETEVDTNTSPDQNDVPYFKKRFH